MKEGFFPQEGELGNPMSSGQLRGSPQEAKASSGPSVLAASIQEKPSGIHSFRRHEPNFGNGKLVEKEDYFP